MIGGMAKLVKEFLWPSVTCWNDIWEYVIRLSLLNDKSLNEFISLLHVSFHV